MSTRSIFSSHVDFLIKIIRELLFHSFKSSGDNVSFSKSRLKRKISELTLTYADIFFRGSSVALHLKYGGLHLFRRPLL